MLDALGITPLEERVYRHLLGVTSASATDVAATLALSSDAIHGALGALEARAIVNRTETEPPQFIAAPPDIVADRLTRRRQLEISEARVELGALLDAYRQGRPNRGADKVIEIISGPGLPTRVLQLQAQGKHEVIGFVKPPFVAISPEAAASKDLPVPVRVIFDGRVMRTSGFIKKVVCAHQPADLLRVHSALPTKLIIIDRELAIMPPAHNAASGTPAAILVRPSGLLDAALALFENYWESSTPLPVPGQPARLDWLSGEHQRVLALLLTGATDDAVARELGISLRTVERRVKELMNTAGAKTRLQLGWYAHANAWVEPQDAARSAERGSRTG